ncbi:MAG: hypothetical protein M3Q07_01840 [Pseudobdellovibrionaceae bacterium]|nr:hypothetical protein [Pseudobdellovibrionaceae bacterium]
MKLSYMMAAALVLISSSAYGDFIAKNSEMAERPSQWKVGDVLEGVGQVTAIERKDGKYLVKATRDGYKIEIMVTEGQTK